MRSLKSSEIALMLKTVQEAVVIAPRVAFALRPTMVSRPHSHGQRPAGQGREARGRAWPA